MLFMIIERFKDNDMLPIYKRIRHGGLVKTLLVNSAL